MFDFEGKVITSNISEFKMFIDVDKNIYNISGILLNEHYGFIIKFNGIRKMLSSLDKLFDYFNFPMTSHYNRAFSKSNENIIKELPSNLFEYNENDFIGKEPAFILHVQFRQNSTWQGMLKWIEKDKTTRFISDLELINLIIDAVGLRNNLFMT